MAIAVRRSGWSNPFAHLITDENYMWWATLPVILGMFIVIVDSSIVNVALPHIMAAFGSSVEDSEWVSTGYMLAAAIMMPTTGFLGERFGRKRLYVLALFLFTLASVLCGAAWSNGSLVFFRILQGIVGGAIQPVGQAMLFEAFPPHKRGMSMAIVGMGAMLAPMLGPTLGGYIVELINWRWIFYVNLVPGLLATFLAFTLLRETSLKKVRLDSVGFFMMAVFLSSFLLGVSQGNSKGWDSTYIVALFAVAAVSFGLFLLQCTSKENPIVDLSLFGNLTYSATTSASVVMGIGLFGGIFLLPVFLQTLMGFDAIQTGLIMMPSGLVVGLMMPIAGMLSNKLDPRVPLIAGMSVMGYSLYLQSFMTPDTSIMTIVGWTMIRGIGMGLAFPAMNMTALGAVPIQKVGQASGLFNVTRQVGGTFGIAILATILTQRTIFHSAILGQDAARHGMASATIAALRSLLQLHGSNFFVAQQQAGAVMGMMVSKQAMVLGFQDTFWIAALIMVFGSLPSLLIRRPAPHAALPPGASPVMHD